MFYPRVYVLLFIGSPHHTFCIRYREDVIYHGVYVLLFIGSPHHPIYRVEYFLPYGDFIHPMGDVKMLGSMSRLRRSVAE